MSKKMEDECKEKYFDWIYDYVYGNDSLSHPDTSRSRLLMELHTIPYIPIFRGDENRANDGIYLRHKFVYRNRMNPKFEEYLVGPCSVLEMMAALAIRCEETIMDDPEYGDRTQQWFKDMIVSLDLGDMSNSRFDKYKVHNAIDQMMHHKYEPNGKGGLFTVYHCDRDLRNEELWIQLQLYINEIP